MTREVEPITITNASVTTVSVDLQVVRIGAKQMTLSVFRQLPERDIFADTGELIAPAWGWINYDRRECSKPFVFSCDGILWRTDVNLDEADWGPYVAKNPIKSGLWHICWDRIMDRFCYLDKWDFASEEGAADYLQRWRESIMELSTAPQLFIGV